MSKKMLITGASGFLGSRVVRYYKDKYEVLTPSHSEMDIADEASVMHYFKKARPDFIIHCAAISDVGRCEREPELSWMYDADDEKRMDFIKQLRGCMYEGKETCFSAKDKRGITDVWEVVRNIEPALELPGGIYNFGSPNDKSTYEMVMDICQSLGCESSYVCVMENANFRNLTMTQEKINQYGILFSNTEDGVLSCFNKGK